MVLPALPAVLVLLLAGCASTTLLGSGRPVPAAAAASASGRPDHPAPTAAVTVIRGWADALRRGDVRGAARYFTIPSVFVDGSGPAVRIRSLGQAEAANEALPCGAKLISATQHGPFVNALFRLTGRPGPGGGTCGTGAGQTARTNFIIVAGRITVWLRAPDQPGDNGSSGTATGPTV